jgi:hypothetical protein
VTIGNVGIVGWGTLLNLLRASWVIQRHCGLREVTCPLHLFMVTVRVTSRGAESKRRLFFWRIFDLKVLRLPADILVKLAGKCLERNGVRLSDVRAVSADTVSRYLNCGRTVS